MQKAAGKPVNFKEMAETLSEIIESNVFVVSRRGNYLVIAVNQQIENDRMKKMFEDRQFPEEYTNRLFNIKKRLQILKSKVNIQLFQRKIKNYLLKV